jgi:hypothetical protein
MSARLALLLVSLGLLAAPAAASATTKHGITPLSPKAGSSVPAGQAVTFKLRKKGAGKVFVHVCKSKKKHADGRICHKADIGQAHKKGGVFRYKAKFYDFPAFWMNNPGTYYWQAYRIACEGGDLSDCYQEGPVVKFRVA